MANTSKSGCGSQNHIRFFSSTKMLGICPLSVEPMNFCFTHAENVGYLSQKIHNTFIYNDLARKKMLGICPRNVGYLSQTLEKCWVFVPKCWVFVPKCWVFVPDSSKKNRFLAKCWVFVPNSSQNVGYLSPKCWVFVPKMLGICPKNVGYLSPECKAKYLKINQKNIDFRPLLLSTTIN